jgi:hypothetical protein
MAGRPSTNPSAGFQSHARKGALEAFDMPANEWDRREMPDSPFPDKDTHGLENLLPWCRPATARFPFRSSYRCDCRPLHKSQ